MTETTYLFDLKQRVKVINTDKVGVIDTLALGSHGQIFYVEFPEKHVVNHWFRPDQLKAVD